MLKQGVIGQQYRQEVKERSGLDFKSEGLRHETKTWVRR